MSLFIILLSPIISATYLESDLTLRARTVTTSSEICIVLWKRNHFVSSGQIQTNDASLFTFITDFLNSPIRFPYKDYDKVLTLLRAVYICPHPKIFCFRRSKSISFADQDQ